MLFAYPEAAVANNWLHECIEIVLLQAFRDLNSGASFLGWPHCLPETQRGLLQRYGKLGLRLTTVIDAYAALTADDRAKVVEALEDQSALNQLFDGTRTAAVRSELPPSMRTPLQELFESAFDTFRAVGLRDSNYKIFFNLLDHKVCAFCGCEFFSPPGSKREPLDHYLAASLYPFAGANTHNLVPMGSRCNSSYKLSLDILRDEHGDRRLCFDPFSPSSTTRITLDRTVFFGRPGGLPSWVIDIEGDQHRVATWDSVFKIRHRYSNEHLDTIYKNSFKIVGAIWKRKAQLFGVNASVADAFRHMADLSLAEGWSDRAFLKRAIYECLHVKCLEGGPIADRLAAEYTDAQTMFG